MATFNVMMGERYKMVPKEFKDLARGKFGHTPKPISRDFLHSIGIQDSEIITDCAVEDAKEKTMAQFREELAEKGYENAPEEDILSYALFPQVAEEFFKKNLRSLTANKAKSLLGELLKIDDPNEVKQRLHSTLGE